MLGLAKKFEGNEDYEPEVTLFVAAYNEKDYVHEKVKNSFDQNFKMNVSLLANGVFFIKLPLKDDVVTLKFIKY